MASIVFFHFWVFFTPSFTPFGPRLSRKMHLRLGAAAVQHQSSVGWGTLYSSLRQQTEHFLLSASKILNIFCLLSPCSAVNQSQFLNPAWRCLNKEKSPSQLDVYVSSTLHLPFIHFFSPLEIKSPLTVTLIHISLFWDLRVVSACTCGRVHVCAHQAVLVGTDPLR